MSTGFVSWPVRVTTAFATYVWPVVQEAVTKLSDVGAYYFYFSMRWALRFVEYAKNQTATDSC